MNWWDLARAQDGAVSREQLMTANVSARSVARMVSSGELVRYHRGVYRAGGAPETWRARLWAAVLATDGTLCKGTAGQLWGVVAPDPRQAVELVVPRDRHVAAMPRVVVRRRDLPVGEVRTRSGLPVTSRERTVLDLLATLPWSEASALADRAVQRGWLSANACRRRLETEPRRHGNAQLHRLARQFGDGAAATSERLLHHILRAAAITGWVPNYEVWVGGELVAVIDVAIARFRLAIEVDGMAYHVDVDRFRGDRARQNTLVALGWTVLRFTWADLTERPGYVTATINRLVRGSAVS